ARPPTGGGGPTWPTCCARTAAAARVAGPNGARRSWWRRNTDHRPLPVMLPRTLEPEVMDSAAEARDYDAMDHAAVNRAFAADFLAVWDGLNPILDVGTGTAQIPIELCRQAPTARVTGIDLAEHMLRVGRENVKRAGLTDRICLERCDAKHAPFADGAFAAVISNSIVHHIPEPAAVLADMVRLVRPGGRLFVRDLLR